MSWKEAWEIYFEENGGALFKDLARYGITMPKCAEQIALEKDHLSHQAWSTFYNYAAAANFHTWVPDEDEMAWLSAKYPNSYDKYYRPRMEYWREQAAKGNRFYNKTLPMLCQTCQIPMIFTEPGDPTKICYREVDYKDSKYHFCSDHCKEIFEHEPREVRAGVAASAPDLPGQLLPGRHGPHRGRLRSAGRGARLLPLRVR